ncbi:MAG: hypothetical protein ABJE95_08600 [Byssovorax sp.]
MSEAKILQCGHCGGSVPLKDLAASTRCRFCGQIVAVPEQNRVELGRYGNAVTAGIKAIRADRSAAKRENAISGLAADSTMAFIILLVFVSLTVHAVVITVGTTWQTTALSSLVVFAVLAWIESVTRRWRRAATSERQIALSAVPVGCSNCGATHAFAIAAGSDLCRSCGAALLPPSTVIVQGKEAIDEMALRARMDYWRARRVSWRMQRRFGDKRGLPDYRINRAGLTRVALVFALVITTAKLLEYAPSVPRPYHRTILLWVLACLPAGALLISLARRIDAAYMGSRWDRGIDGLRQQLVGDQQDPVGWLNEVWAGQTPQALNGGGMYHRVIMLRRDGYPMMIYASTSSIVLLLAAWIPDVSDRHESEPVSTAWIGTPLATAILSELEASDFNVTVARAGLVATVCRNSMAEFRRHPDRLVALAPAVRRVADFAVAMGAKHVDEVLIGASDAEAAS